METTDKEHLERKLNHVLDMGDRIIKDYQHITCTERSALLLAMSAATHQVAANVRNIAAMLRRNLLDPFGIDYIDYARRVENLLKKWQEELVGLPVFYNLDSLSRPLTDPEEIVEKEDHDYELTMKGEDIYLTRKSLMRNSSQLTEETCYALALISKELRNIVDDYSRLKADQKRQEKCLGELERMYAEQMWDYDRQTLIEEALDFVEVEFHGDKGQKTFVHLLKRKLRSATDPHDQPVLAELNGCYLKGKNTAEFVVRHRDKLNFEQLASHFCFVRSYRLLSDHIESFVLRQPASARFADLFVNRAAEELTTLLVPTIKCYIDFQYNYQFAALQMVLIDLGLIYPLERRNSSQMAAFINEYLMPKGRKINDQKTLTLWTGKLLGRSFSSLSETDLRGTNFSLEDYRKLFDLYWLCLSLFNSILQIDIDSKGFSPHLLNPHPFVSQITDYFDSDGKSVKDRLYAIKSVSTPNSAFC